MMEEEIQKSLEVLRKGGTLLYPTDTIWGIGCDATSEQAVEKIFAVKQRDPSKSLIVLVSDEGMLNRFVKNVPAQAWDLIEISDSPLTLIYDEARGIAKNALAEDGSIGVRVVKQGAEGGDDFCHRLIHKFGKPMVSTSANKSGDPSPGNFSEVNPDLHARVDYVVNWRRNEPGGGKASSILRLKGNGEIKIIRK